VAAEDIHQILYIHKPYWSTSTWKFLEFHIVQNNIFNEPFIMEQQEMETNYSNSLNDLSTSELY
jgi:hypothetical protein